MGYVTQISTRVKPAVRWGVEHGLQRGALHRAAKHGDMQGRLVEEAAARPTPELAGFFDEVRAGGPLVRTRFTRLTADHAVVKEALTSADLHAGFPSTGLRSLTRLAEWSQNEIVHPVKAPSLLAVDGPDHARYRKLVTKVFTVRAVEALRGRVESIAADLLDELADSGHDTVEMVEQYCSRLPVMVIAEILGVPDRDHDRVRGYGAAAAPSLDLGLSWRTFRAVDAGLAEFDRWLEEHLESLRRDPGDDLMSKLAVTRDEEGGLDARELKSTAGLVLAAGFETTVNLLGNAIVALDAHPEQRDLLVAEPDRWPNAVEEVLRYDPPVLLTGRMAGRRTTIAGQSVEEGTVVVALLAGANRDPQVFDDPHTFDVTRENARDHMAFSAGRHYCLGAALAKMEGEVGLRMLYERYPNLRVEPGARRRSTRILRGFERLPVRLAG